MKIPTIMVWGWVGLSLTIMLSGCDEDTTQTSTNSAGFTVSGVVQASPQTAVDSDVNDPNAQYAPNNTLDTAQTISNPVIIGGYVNRPGAGDSGRSQSIGDEVDIFRVELTAGQVIHLFVASEDLSFNDVDLVLKDSTGTVVDAGVSLGESENLSISASGVYYIQVLAYSGASNYVLTIGQDAALRNLALSSLRLSADFVPADVLVQWKSAPQSADNQLHALSLAAQSYDEQRRMRYTVEDVTSLTQAAEDLVFTNEQARQKYATLLAAKALQRRTDVASASLNHLYYAQRVPNDSLYRYQWHYPAIHLPQAWDTTQGDSNVTVAVVDTGALMSHPDLQGKLVNGYDFIADRTISLDGDGLDSNPDDPGSFANGTGTNFHGSHVAGTIGASTANGTGVAGVGWNTTVMPLRALGKNGAGSEYDIEQAVRYAAGLRNDSGQVPSRHADVINLSLGGAEPPTDNVFQTLVNDARRNGVIIVAASGNQGASTVNYPAALDGVVAVGAVNINRQRAYYSNYGSALDLMAPGGDNATDVNGDGIPDGVVSTLGDSSQSSLRYIYDYSIGTSMASPHVAGVIALMKAVYPGLTPDEFDSLMNRGELSDDLGTSGADTQYGYGLINANKAVQAALQLASGSQAQVVARLSVSPESLNFATDTTRLPLRVTNAGGGTLAITRITEDSGGYINVSPTSDVDSNRMGTYYVEINRSGLSAGTYTANLVFFADTQRVIVPVLWQVLAQGTQINGDAGRQFVLLIDPVSLETVKELQLTPVSGQYRFSFSGVTNGSYILVSGSDNDNNFSICEGGESCGAYLTLDKPTEFAVNRNLAGLNFTVNFSTNFISLSSVEAASTRTGFARIPLRRLGE